MPTYKFTYFNGKGRAETMRFALAASGQEFEDIRLTGEEFMKLKADLPQGVLPILEVDGKVICQSGAILRYLAREHGFYGKNNAESTDVDTVLLTMTDFFSNFEKIFTTKDDEAKKELIKEMGEKTVPKFVEILCKILCGNGGDGWIAGQTVTVADFAVYCMFELLPLMFGPEAVTPYNENEKLRAHFNRVAEHPPIKAWLEKRPKSAF